MNENIPNNCTEQLAGLLREASALSVRVRLLAAELNGAESELAVAAGDAIRLVTVAAEAPATPESFREALLDALGAREGTRTFRNPAVDAARSLLVGALEALHRMSVCAGYLLDDDCDDVGETTIDMFRAYGKSAEWLRCAIDELRTEPEGIEGLSLATDQHGRETVKDWQGRVYAATEHLPTGLLAGCAAIRVRAAGERVAP